MLYGQLILPSKVTLRGEGRDSTILDFTPWTIETSVPPDKLAAIVSEGNLGVPMLLDNDAPKGATTLSVESS